MARTNDSVAHDWAHGRDAKTGNLFSESGVIYSYGYHFPIARWVHAKVRFVAFTTDSYSMSTSRHKNLVSRAIPSYYRVLNVHNPVADPKDWLKVKMALLVELEGKYGRARSNKPYILSQMQEVWTDIQFIGEQFDLEVPQGEFDFEALEAAFVTHFEAIKREEAEKKERERLAQERRDAMAAEAIEEWKRGERQYAPHTSKIALRTNKARDGVETSWGAFVPTTDTAWLWRTIEQVRAQGVRRAWTNPPHVGTYPLNWIEANGAVGIGCHVLEYDEMRRIAKELGYVSEPEETATM